MNIECKQCKPGFGGNGDSVRIFADISKNPFWTGFVVAVKRDYFGETPARGLNLSGARRLVFYAKSDQENVYIQVKAAVNHDKPFGDSAELPITSEWEPLNQDWQRFEIPIRGNVDLSRVISPLALFVDRNHNPDQDVITFYIDEIYYEF